MKRKTSTPDPTHAAIAAFLEAHYAHVHVNDVGPLLGRLASLCDEHSADGDPAAAMERGDQSALTGQAPPGLR